MVTVRSVLVVVSDKKRRLYQMDVFNDFLQGDLDEENYMELLQNFRNQWRLLLTWFAD